MVGYWFDLPFGDVGTNIWGVYSKPTSAQNYFAGAVKVCGTDTVANTSVALEVESTTKAMVLSRMSTVQKNALTAIAGMMVFDTTLSQLSYYDGGAWVNL
jgi:histidinol dehydrogenase